MTPPFVLGVRGWEDVWPGFEEWNVGPHADSGFHEGELEGRGRGLPDRGGFCGTRLEVVGGLQGAAGCSYFGGSHESMWGKVAGRKERVAKRLAEWVNVGREPCAGELTSLSSGWRLGQAPLLGGVVLPVHWPSVETEVKTKHSHRECWRLSYCPQPAAASARPGESCRPRAQVSTQVAARGRGSLRHRPHPGASFALPWAVQGEGRHREEGTGLRLPVSGWQKAEFLCPCLCSRGEGGRKPQRAPGVLPAAAWGLEQRPGCPEDTTGRSPGSRPGGPGRVAPSHAPPPH